jgi:serine phosphatase RsbU (regulator of sigma subunit)
LLETPSERPDDFDLATYWKASADRFRDEVSQAVEAHRRAMAEKQEAERHAARELEIAKEVQARLFPQTMPPASTLDYYYRVINKTSLC